MSIDLQKGSVWKRIAAWILDWILLSVLAVGAAWALSLAFGFDGYNEELLASYERYETQFGISFEAAQADPESLNPEERLAVEAAFRALAGDADAMYAYNMVINLTLIITTLSLLLGSLVLEFAVPMALGNGQTVGKKVFSLGLIRNDGVKVNPMQLFARAVLGKFTLETMIPVYLILMILWGYLGLLGTLALAGIGVLQLAMLGLSRTNALLHDLIAGTVVVDVSSQRIFSTTEDLITYTKRVHAERAAREDY